MSDIKTFKERWLLEDIKCEKCGQIISRQRGLTKQNLKRLLKPTWNVNEILITFMIIMILFLAFSYKSEVKQCQDWIGSMYSGDIDNCKFMCDSRCDTLNKTYKGNIPLNITNLSLFIP